MAVGSEAARGGPAGRKLLVREVERRAQDGERIVRGATRKSVRGAAAEASWSPPEPGLDGDAARRKFAIRMRELVDAAGGPEVVARRARATVNVVEGWVRGAMPSIEHWPMVAAAVGLGTWQELLPAAPKPGCTSLAELTELPRKAIHALAFRLGCRTLEDVAALTRAKLLAERNLGPTAVRAIRSALNARGVRHHLDEPAEAVDGRRELLEREAAARLLREWERRRTDAKKRTPAATPTPTVWAATVTLTEAEVKPIRRQRRPRAASK